MNGIQHAWSKLASLLDNPGAIPSAVAAMEGAILFLQGEGEADADDLYELWWKAEQINAVALADGVIMSGGQRGDLDKVFNEMASLVSRHTVNP
ncbi:MAG: hypothetical protein JWM90_2361 [Thermoleophilia bacterium]|nr:hypothetical protein [Thermoleophilia bacterium]